MNKSFRKTALRLIVLSLFIGLNYTGFLAVGNTVSYFTDTEDSAENSFHVAVLDFSLSSPADFAPEVTLEQTTARTINVVQEGLLDFDYTVRVEEPVGVLCNYLTLEDGFGTSMALDNFQSAEAIFPAKPSWNFTASLTSDDPDLQGQTCSFKLIYEGRQIGLCSGFSDIEEIENTITAGEWGGPELLINKVYYDVDSAHGTEPDNEWIELYNPTAGPVNLQNWELCNRNTCEIILDNVSIPSLGFAVVSRDSGTWDYWNIPNEVVKISYLGGELFEMDNDADMLMLKNPDGGIVDQMNWGIPNLCSFGGAGWAKTYSEFSYGWGPIQQVADDGYVVGSEYLFKLDSDGEQVWLKDFAICGCDDITTTYAEETSDGGYIVTARCHTGGSSVPVMFKTDPASNPVWAKAFAIGGYDSSNMMITSLEQTSDGGYVMGGYVTEGYYNHLAFIIKTDSLGSQQWAKKHAVIDTGSTIVRQTSDGDYVIAGMNPRPSSPTSIDEIYLAKLDPSGNNVWANIYGGYSSTQHLTLSSLEETFGGGYVMTANYYAGSSGSNALIVKIDSAGSVVQSKEYATPGTTADLFYHAIQTSDGGYIIVGKYKSMTEGHMYSGLIIKTDAGFNQTWAKSFAAPGTIQDNLEFVQQTSDGGYIITGSSKPSGGSYEALLVKIDSSGNITLCDALQDLTTLTEFNAGFSIRAMGPFFPTSIIIPFATPTVFDPAITLAPNVICAGGTAPPCVPWPNYNSNVWDPGVDDVAEGHILGRYPTGTDTDTVADWVDFGLPEVVITNALGSIWYCGGTYPVRFEVNNPNGAPGELTVDMYYITDDGSFQGIIDANDTVYLVKEDLPFNSSPNGGQYMFHVTGAYCYYGYVWVKLVVTGPENPMLNNHYTGSRIFEPPMPEEGGLGMCWIDVLAEMEAELGPEFPVDEPADDIFSLSGADEPAVLPEGDIVGTDTSEEDGVDGTTNTNNEPADEQEPVDGPEEPPVEGDIFNLGSGADEPAVLPEGDIIETDTSEEDGINNG